MVNVTYDACEYYYSRSFYVTWLKCNAAGQLKWFDPDKGTTVVYNGGDIAWTLASTALVWIMVPGVGFFYSGLLRRKNGLSMIYLSVGTIAVVSFQVCLAFIKLPISLTALFSGFSGVSPLRLMITQTFSLEI